MTLPTLGVVIVTFNAKDVILDCLESLLAAQGVQLAIIVVDNASTDGTPDLLWDWAAGRLNRPPSDDIPFALAIASRPLRLLESDEAPLPKTGHGITVIEAGMNGGFAAGVNVGLALLTARPGIDRFWVLNPDIVVPPGTPCAFATEPAPPGGFALMGGRVIYLDTPDQIQIDGGTINWRTGVTSNVNQYADPVITPPPDPARMDFITGASMVASRAFYEAAGPMPEDYFLYYEEVDWALRRGGLPLTYCKDAIIYHRAGTAIGSPTLGRPASPFSLYFKHRGRIRFVRRHLPRALPGALMYSLAKAAQLGLKGFGAEARAVLAGSFNRPPAPEIRARLSPEAARLAAFPDQ